MFHWIWLCNLLCILRSKSMASMKMFLYDKANVKEDKSSKQLIYESILHLRSHLNMDEDSSGCDMSRNRVAPGLFSTSSNMFPWTLLGLKY